ncbi:lariat debranching enzyme isoform X2 [Selaginella moellendorffii]|uniref:lariat debranching enzyme isoform X2 n=1 Tax=Selaginella moellendorffii TaxID=88036 RepID=UPI000D1C43EC|nr:lariat debranching enzyme isoform X2 [Selaginella moellendorffii]|eukprot:XP_024536303.1 lariat debranching enzyme isoform X2 [Selaginella moellendorffii]
MALRDESKRTMRVAVVGCAHGELDKIFATVRHVEASEGLKIDLLLCCGDFQAVRNELDLQSLACPPKYRSMNSFWKYYAGIETAPCTTVFIGGNHEASNYLWELYYGGWVAPNIYYLGAAGVIWFGGLRIGGLSGIYKQHDYHRGHFERPPYNLNELRSVFHVREYDVHKLLQIKEPIDIFMSHDWPQGIAQCGDLQGLLRYKPFLQQEIADNVLGSVPARNVLLNLKPSYWFSAHLHAKFAAIVKHGDEKTTKFLALDKCLPGRPFLQVFDFPTADGTLEVTYDKEWLGITRAYHSCFPLERVVRTRACSDIKIHRDWVENLSLTKSLIPSSFQQTAPIYDPHRKLTGPTGHAQNPQTEYFLDLLQLPYLLDATPGRAQAGPVVDFNEIRLEDEEEHEKGCTVADPNEIVLANDDTDATLR